MLHPLHSRYVPDPSKEAIFPSNSHQHVQWTQGELGCSVVIFLSIAVECPPVPSRFEFGMEAYVETPYRVKIILYYVNSITIMTCNYCIRWYRLCGFLLSPSAFVCLQTCLLQAIWRTTLVWCAWFPGGWYWSQRVHRSATACFFPNAWTTSIYFPVWYHRWWSNLGEFQSRKTKQVSLMDCPYSWWWSSMFGNVYILYRRQACRVCRLDTFDGNMYVATTSALTWCIVVELIFSFNFPPSAAPCKL